MVTKEKRNEYANRYRDKNRDKYNKYANDWYQKHKEEQREYRRKWRKNKKELARQQGIINVCGYIDHGEEPRYMEDKDEK